MFSRIPQRLTAPFGILGDEAKLSFRSQPGGIAKLATIRNIPETDSYWDQYITLFDSASDVFSLITPQDIRRALLDAPENVATLVRVVISRLFNLISDHTFPSTNNASVAALASSLIRAGTGVSERNVNKEVLNCIRILQRFMPVIFEVEGESNVFEMEVLWKQSEAEYEDENEVASTDEPQFVIEDDDDSDDGEAKSLAQAQLKTSDAKQKKKLPSMGEKLFSCIIDLLFCCGFTIPTKIQVDHYKINYVIWEKGVGSTSDPGPNHAYDSNKTEVLRLLLVLLSRQIYIPSTSLLSKPSLYTLHFVRKTPRRNVLTILCSLLNTVMNSIQFNIASLGDVAGKLPYNHLVFKGEDPRSTLVSVCFQVLDVLLDFQSGDARDVPTTNGDSAPTVQTNAFRYFLMKLHRSQDFAFIMDGIIGILEQEIASMNNVLPGAKKPLAYLPETILFFWKMIELNRKFRIYALESERSMDLVAYLLCYCLEIKDKPQQHGLCRSLSYIVQTLSAETAFGLKLSSPVKAHLPAKWNFGGNAGDFLINAVYNIIATTSGSLNFLYPALIIALSNASPYFKNITVQSSARLIQLFNSFSNPMFLFADEGHPRLLFFMLEVFNGPILHNAAENANLLYGILGAHKSFENLGTFTLAQGLREISRIQSAKDERTEADESKAKNLAQEDPHDEKARLRRSESQGEVIFSVDEFAGAPSANDQGAISNTPPPSSPPETPISPSMKARGKMKERRSLSLDNNGSLERAAISVGRNGFVPTQEWVTSWQQGLPLDAVMLLISELLPKIQEMQRTHHKVTSTATIMDFLGSVNLKHVLPPTPPIAPRRFMWSDASMIWLTSLIWGEVYVRGMAPPGIWNSTNVKLFYVKHAQTQSRQITGAVSNVVGGMFGRAESFQGSRQRAERS